MHYVAGFIPAVPPFMEAMLTFPGAKWEMLQRPEEVGRVDGAEIKSKNHILGPNWTESVVLVFDFGLYAMSGANTDNAHVLLALGHGLPGPARRALCAGVASAA
eukprot:2112833-Rhodomonas_salina.3